MPAFIGSELTGQVVHAYGPHVVNPHVVQKITTGTGDDIIATVVGILGEGVWQGLDRLTWKGRDLVLGTDYHFHPGYLPNDPADSAHGGAQAVDSWVPGGSNYSGSAYIVAKLPVDSVDDDDFTSLKAVAKCLLVMDYDVNGNELGLIYTANPANVFLDIYINVRGNPKGRVNFASWFAWKQFCAAPVTWIGGSVPARPLFSVFTNAALGADASVFKSSTSNAWDSGAMTEAIIPLGVNGFFEFDAGAGTFAGGLIDASSFDFINSNAMKFGVQCNSATPTGDSGVLSINLNGTNTAFGTWTTGDRFRTAVELDNGTPVFKLYKNGIVQNLGAFSVPTVTGDYRGGVAFFHGATDILRSTFSPINTGSVGGERTRERFTAGLAFVSTTDTSAAMEAVLYLSCSNFADIDGQLYFLPPSMASAPRAATFDFTESNIVEDTVSVTRISRNKRITHLLGKVRDTDSPYLVEATVPADRDTLEDILHKRVDGGEVYLGSMTQGQAKCVLEYQMRMSSDLDLFCSFKGDGTTMRVTPGDVVTVTHSLMGWNLVKFLVLSVEIDESADNADTRTYNLQAFDPAVYSDTDQAPLSVNIPYTLPGDLTPAPPALDIVLEQLSEWGLNDAFTTLIRGTVVFAESSATQRARIWVYKPTATAPIITNIVVTPDAPAFEYQAQTNGPYTFYAVVENRVGYRDPALALPDDSTNETITVDAPELTLGIPLAVTATFSVSSVEIAWQRPANPERVTEYEVWTNISDLSDLTKRIYFGSATRTTYQVGVNAPTTQLFWVRSVNRMGQTSSFVVANNGVAVPIVQLTAPTNYIVGYNGVETIHSFLPLAAAANVSTYQIATDAGFTNIVGSGKGGAILIPVSRLPGGRSWSFYLRAVDNIGSVGPAAQPTPQPFSLPTFPAPALVFDPNRIFPFNAILVITPPSGIADTRQVKRTIVEVSTTPNFAQFVQYRYEGVAETADISGRLSLSPTVYVRAYYVDHQEFAGTVSQTATVTFGGISGGDIAPGTIGITQLASSLTIPQIVATLPILPNATYPNNGAIVFNQADGKLYRNVGNVWTAAVPTGDLFGQIAAGQLAVDAVTAGTIAAAAISAREIAANAITAEKIAVDSISARHLYIGGFTDNVVMNSEFAQVTSGKADGWAEYNVAGYTIGATGNNYAALGNTQGIVSKAISVEPGDMYAVRVQLSATAGTHTIGVRFKANVPVPPYVGNGLIGLPNSDDVILLLNNASLTTTKTAYEYNFTVPAGMFWMSVFAIGGTAGQTLSVHEFIAKRQVGDAFISTLRASKIIGETIGAGLVFADQIKQTSYLPYQPGSVYEAFAAIDTTHGAGHTSLNTDTDTITKTASDGNWNSAVASPTSARIERGNGYAECVVASASENSMFGLTANYNSASYTGIDFAWYMTSANTLSIYEGGTLMATSVAPYVVGDRLRVAIENGFVRYYKNDVLFYTSPYSPTSTIRGFTYTTAGGYRAVFAANTAGAAIRRMALVQAGYGSGWRLNPLSGSQVFDVVPVWVNATGTTSVTNGGRTVSKPSGSNAWDAKVASTQTIAAGDGYIEFIHSIAATNLAYAVGLVGTGLLSGSSYTDLDFSFVLHANGTYSVYERGVDSGPSAQPYVQGDSFRVAIEGGLIKYRKNGAVVWTSTNQSYLSYPVAAKVVLNGVGISVSGFSFTASSSGAGEFNSGVTVTGERLEDTVRLVRTGIRKSDNKWRGADVDVPSSAITSVTLNEVFIPFDDARCHVSLNLNIDDYLTSRFKNLDTQEYVRVRAYDWFGRLLLPNGYQDFRHHGKGNAGMFWQNRDFADPYNQAVYSFQLGNIYGLSKPIYWTMPDITWTNFGARAGTFTNYGETPPIFKDMSYHPTNLRAIAISETSVVLSWTNPAGNTGANCSVNYRPYRSAGYLQATPGWVFVGTTTSGSQVITGLSPNGKYEFMVDSPSAGGLNDGYLWTAFVHLRMPTTPAPAPTYPAPTGVNAAAVSTTAINVTWTPNGSPTNVEISRRNVTTGGSWSVISATYSSAQPYADSGLTEGNTYAYKIRNNYSGNYSSFSAEGSGTTFTTAPPSHTPTNLVGTSLFYYTIRASWTTNGSGSNHRIEYIEDTGVSDFTGASAITGASSPTTISGLQPGVTYRMRVRAESPSTSAWSNDALATTLVYIEPDPGDGCVVYDTPIIAMDEDERQYLLRADEIRAGQRLVSITSSGARVAGRVKRVFSAHTSRLFTIVTESGHILTCSPGHPVVTGYGNLTEKVFALKTGNSVLVYNQHSDKVSESRIASIEYVDISMPVLIFEMENDEHTFVSGNIVSHNIRAKY